MTKRVGVALVLAAAVTAVAVYAASQHISDEPALGANVVTSEIRSDVLGEVREYLVHLPESYSRDTARRYPVLYVLDGSSQSVHTAESAALMARGGAMPEILVVGIPSMGAEARQRDYTPPGIRQDADDADSPQGSGDRFLAFLRAELIPCIDRDYRTDGSRLLAGNSRGALLVVYSLIAEPLAFDARFAHSPALWRDDGAIIERMERFLVSSPNPHGFFYLSLGDKENEKMTNSFRRAVASLEAHAAPSLRWRADLTPGATHGDNARLATPVGLRAFYGALVVP